MKFIKDQREQFQIPDKSFRSIESDWDCSCSSKIDKNEIKINQLKRYKTKDQIGQIDDIIFFELFE